MMSDIAFIPEALPGTSRPPKTIRIKFCNADQVEKAFLTHQEILNQTQEITRFGKKCTVSCYNGILKIHSADEVHVDIKLDDYAQLHIDSRGDVGLKRNLCDKNYEHIKLNGKNISVDCNLVTHTLQISGDTVTCREYISTKYTKIITKRFNLIGNGGLEGTKSLYIEAYATFVNFGCRIAGKIAIITGAYINLGGIVQFSDLYVNSFIEFDASLAFPKIPENISDMTNFTKCILALRVMCKFLYAPLGSLVKLAHKIYTVFKKTDSAFDGYAKYAENSSDGMSKLSLMKTMLTVKAILFAGAAIYTEKSYLAEVSAKLPDVNNNSLPQMLTGVLYHALPMVLPAYLRDSILSFSGPGLTCSGVNGEENLYSYNLKSSYALYR